MNKKNAKPDTLTQRQTRRARRLYFTSAAAMVLCAALTVPAREFVRACGNPDSERLFGRGDYLEFLLNRWCRERS